MSGDIIEKREGTYVQENFEVRACGGSTITTKNVPDPIARLANTLIKLIEKANTLPKIIVVVVENDVIKAINPDKDGQSVHYGQAIEWIIDQHVDILDKFKGYLPKKAKIGKEHWPFIMWISPCIHENFEEIDYQRRKKFTKCLEKIAHGDREIIAMRLMKQIWDQKDPDLVNIHHRFTTEGWNVYWSAVDNAVKYFDEKIIPGIVEKKNANKYFPRRSWKEDSASNRRDDTYRDSRNDKHTTRNTYSDRPRAEMYERTHWSKNSDSKMNTKKIFGRQHKFDENRRRLPTPPPRR